MLALFWVYPCLMILCCGQGKSLGYARSSAMKEFPLLMRRGHRTFRAVGSCFDINNNQISNDKYYVPSGQNACLHCKCVSGEPKECFTTNCAVPTCPDYKAVPGQCCRYTCPEEGSEDTQLAVIVSLSLGLLVLVILLIVVVVRNVKKNRHNREVIRHTEEQGEQPRNNNVLDTPLNNQLTTIQETQERSFEPPPPYTPVRNINKTKAHHIQPTAVIPNEPPPPYEIQTNMRATTV